MWVGGDQLRRSRADKTFCRPQSSGEDGRANLRVVGVAGEEGGPPLSEHVFGGVLGRTAEVACQASGGDLKPKPPFDQPPKVGELGLALLVTFRVCEDRLAAGDLALEKKVLQRVEPEAQWQFKEEMRGGPSDPVLWSCREGGQELRCEVAVCPGQELQGQPGLLESLPENGQGLVSRFRARVPLYGEGVWGCHNGGDAVLNSSFRHGEGRVDVGGAVIEPGQDMAVDVNHGESSVSACIVRFG